MLPLHTGHHPATHSPECRVNQEAAFPPLLVCFNLSARETGLHYIKSTQLQATPSLHPQKSECCWQPLQSSRKMFQKQ